MSKTNKEQPINNPSFWDMKFIKGMFAQLDQQENLKNKAIGLSKEVYESLCDFIEEQPSSEIAAEVLYQKVVEPDHANKFPVMVPATLFSFMVTYLGHKPRKQAGQLYKMMQHPDHAQAFTVKYKDEKIQKSEADKS